MAHATKATTKMVRNMGKALTCGAMVHVMWAIGMITRSMGKAFTHGSMEEPTKDLGRTIICMDKVPTLGVTVVSMKENITWTKSMVTEYISGRTEDVMKATGRMESNTEKGNISCRMALLKSESGKMGKESDG